MQISEMDSFNKQPENVGADRLQGAGRTSTAIFLFVGMAAVYILSAFLWLHLMGGTAKR